MPGLIAICVAPPPEPPPARYDVPSPPLVPSPPPLYPPVAYETLSVEPNDIFPYPPM